MLRAGRKRDATRGRSDRTNPDPDADRNAERQRQRGTNAKVTVGAVPQAQPRSAVDHAAPWTSIPAPRTDNALATSPGRRSPLPPHRPPRADAKRRARRTHARTHAPHARTHTRHHTHFTAALSTLLVYCNLGWEGRVTPTISSWFSLGATIIRQLARTRWYWCTEIWESNGCDYCVIWL